MKYHSEKKKTKKWTTETYIELKNMVNKRIQSQKNYWFHLYVVQEQENELMLTEIWKRCRGVKIDYRGAKETSWGDGNALQLVLEDGYRNVHH